ICAGAMPVEGWSTWSAPERSGALRSAPVLQPRSSARARNSLPGRRFSKIGRSEGVRHTACTHPYVRTAPELLEDPGVEDAVPVGLRLLLGRWVEQSSLISSLVSNVTSESPYQPRRLRDPDVGG